MGVMGQLHAATLAENKCINLVAVCVRDRGRAANLNLTCEVYDDYSQMLQKANLDLVIVATPHRLHKEFCIAAIQSGKHVICEKPMATSVTEANEILAAANSANTCFTVVCQNRFEPSYRSVKTILESGTLGPIRRCSITETFWRPDSYYQSADWRGTWSGEAGGVLMNQAPHTIDRYIWLCGRPDRVTAVCDTALHKIEVEDVASLILHHKNGIQGHIHVSTNECPPLNRLEVACDKGRITVQHGEVLIEKLAGSIVEETSADAQQSDRLSSTTERLRLHSLNWSSELLHRFYEDFATAIWARRTAEVTAEQGRDVVEIINAAHLSSWKQTHINLPVAADVVDSFQKAMLEGHSFE